MKHSLGDVDPKYANLLLHWTRLLWLNGFIGFELIVAHRSRSAQGRAHFIMTTNRHGLAGRSRAPRFGCGRWPSSPRARLELGWPGPLRSPDAAPGDGWS